MSYTGKTNWQLNEPVMPADMNRIEQGIIDANNKQDRFADAEAKTDLLTTDEFAVLSSNEGKASKRLTYALLRNSLQNFFDSRFLKISSIVNDLTTGGTAVPASAETVKNLNTSKVDKISGKGLSTNDYTTVEKTKVSTALQPTGGTMTGELIAGGLQDEAVAQMRNIQIVDAGTEDFSAIPNCTIIFVEEEE